MLLLMGIFVVYPKRMRPGGFGFLSWGFKNVNVAGYIFVSREQARRPGTGFLHKKWVPEIFPLPFKLRTPCGATARRD
jgi:hypothetical protein